MTPGTMTHLQRVVGNATVARMVHERRVGAVLDPLVQFRADRRDRETDLQKIV